MLAIAPDPDAADSDRVTTDLVVGFDLDMTLIDSRAGIGAVYDRLVAESGAPIDVAAVISRLGPRLEDELATWVPPEQVEPLTDRYRELYPSLAVPVIEVLVGAHAALAAVRTAGGSSVVVTAKNQADASMHVDRLGLGVDFAVGGLWGTEKATALTEHGASVYVGDHVHDVEAARAAGAVSVAVATGPCSRDELVAAGADVVLEDLTHFPAWLDDHLLDRRLAALELELARAGSILVAFSGGADSAFLLAAAVRTLGAGKVAAATAYSGSLPASERDPAAQFCADLGIAQVTPSTHEMDREGYRANAGDRCYFCKAELVDVLAPVAAELGLATVATGTNADDALAGFRPGIRAAAERGAITPLRDAGFTKAQVRAASQRWGLPTWDKPAAACLSSRIAYGIEVTPHRLDRVERAEAGLRDLFDRHAIAVRNLRVRDLGDRARVEVDGELVARVAAHVGVLDTVRQVGFSEVEIDPIGFRSGSMNELLDPSANNRPGTHPGR